MTTPTDNPDGEGLPQMTGRLATRALRYAKTAK
jgi:hypothetical protein